MAQEQKSDNNHIVLQNQSDLYPASLTPKITPREEPSEINLFTQSKHLQHIYKSFRESLKHPRLTFHHLIWQKMKKFPQKSYNNVLSSKKLFQRKELI